MHGGKAVAFLFSISCPRILPTGFKNILNEPGAEYYSNLIDGLLAKNIEPIVTLYHWELPVKIQDLGGWTNPLSVDWFADYARVVFSLCAGRVKTWITINEAISVCDYSFNSGLYAPGIKETEFAPYLCNKHVLLAHAKAYRIFKQEFKSKYDARISISNYELWIESATANYTELAELGREHCTGRFSHSIYSKEGGWPPSIEKLMLNYSLKQGYSTSRLPAFTRQVKEFVKGTADFYAINYYTTSMIRSAQGKEDRGIKCHHVSSSGCSHFWTVCSTDQNLAYTMWISNTQTKQGLQHIAHRKSAYYYSCVIRNRTLDVNDTCYEEQYTSKYFKDSIHNGGTILQNSNLFLMLITFYYI